jgi:hypothetical protein
MQGSNLGRRLELLQAAQALLLLLNLSAVVRVIGIIRMVLVIGFSGRGGVCRYIVGPGQEGVSVFVPGGADGGQGRRAGGC